MSRIAMNMPKTMPRKAMSLRLSMLSLWATVEFTRAMGKCLLATDLGSGIDRGDNRKAGAQQARRRNLGRNLDPNRHALRDLGEIARRILRRQEAEGRPGGGGDAFDAALEDAALQR